MLNALEHPEQVEQVIEDEAGLGFEPFRSLFRLFRIGRLSALGGRRINNGSDMTDRGLHADLRAIIDQDDLVDDGDQLSLAMFDDFESPVHRRATDRGVRTGRPGRPEGSKNRATLNIVRLIKATKRPTLLALKEWADMDLTDFMMATGISDADKAFSAWFRVAELCAAYEEGRPTQRVELDGKVAVLPVAIFGDAPVRPDLAEGNPPIEGEAVEVTDWTSTNDMDQDEGSSTKAHDGVQSLPWPDDEA